MADAGLKIKLDAFNAFTRELASRTGSDLPTVIRSEAIKILEAAGKRTKVATAASIRKSQESPPRSPWRTYDGQKVNTKWRFPSQKWSDIKSRLDRSVSNKIAMAGLARSAWEDLADMIGQPISVPKSIKAAKPSGFRGRSNVNINEDPNRYAITISHNSKALFYANGQQALFAAIAGRINFYRKNEKMGVFKSAQAVAKKYPGVRVSTSTS